MGRGSVKTGSADPATISRGLRLYTANLNTPNVSLFPLDGNGDVQAFHTTGTGGNLPQLLALNPARTRLDLTNFSTSPNGTVAAFGLDANGDIQSGPTNTVMPAGAGNPYGVAVR